MSLRLIAVHVAVLATVAGAGLVPAPSATAAWSPAQNKTDLASAVDPLIGSAQGGNTFPGAMRPHGMLSWSPTTTTGDQTSTSAANGYSYAATRARGFSLTHVNGAGCNPGAAGDIPIMPWLGKVTTSPSADTTDAIYASNFSHSNEKAAPGRYSVMLDSGVGVDLAAADRSALGSFSFPAGSAANILFRTSNSLNGSEDADVTIDPRRREVSGSVLTGAFCGRRANGGVNNRRTYLPPALCGAVRRTVRVDRHVA